jgi:membrane protease YdiL (CAAX protease family)
LPSAAISLKVKIFIDEVYLNSTFLIAQVSEWLGVIAVAWLLSLNPRFKQGQIGFLYARRDGLTAVAMSFTVIAFAFIFATTGLGQMLTGLVRLPARSADLSRPLAIAVLSLLPVLAALILRAQPPKSTGWSLKLLRPALSVGLALILLTIFLRNRVMDVVSGISPEEGYYLLGALGIALAEETIFRGYIQLRLGWWLGENRGWLATALVYAAWRLPLLLGSSSLPLTLLYLAVALAQGLVTGWLMRKCGHVLAPALYRAISIWLVVFA